MPELAAKHVLVTGGAGAVGSHVVRILLARGAMVTIVDDLSSGFERNVPTGAKFLKKDIRELDHVDLMGVDVVVHLAAKFANQNSVEHPIDDLDVNAHGTLRMLQMAQQVSVQRFVYASTSCVTQLMTPYAISKFAGEQYALFFAQHHRLSVNVVRYFNSYGPFDYPGQYRSVIPNFMAAAMRGEPLTVLGDGSDTRDFTFVGDAAEATVLAAETAHVGEVFELGAGRPVSILTLAKAVNAVTGNAAGVQFLPRRNWDTVKNRRADPAYAEVMLGFNPQTTLEEGLAQTYTWMQSIASEYVHRR